MAQAQGFWSASAGDGSVVSATILPDGQAWVVYERDGAVSAVAQASLVRSGTAYSGSGQYFPLSGASAQAFTLSGSLPGSAADGLPVSIRIGTAAPGPLAWTYNKAYDTPTVQASLAGRWIGKLGANVLSWDVDGAGRLSGTSTTGCLYGGSLTVHPGAAAVLDAAITETCAGVVQTLTGVARLGAGQAGLSLVYLGAPAQRAGAVLLSRQ
ncbi:hypothetical protein F1609_20390 [Massilia sp. CCM 8693]|uniref:Uncharacterized protein n=1 Tax=Massilia aquatica TaxID=2609000 RepID=A0ABX0M5L7_9BURK|nr:hypothetical protein [Massilia aquatica]